MDRTWARASPRTGTSILQLGQIATSFLIEALRYPRATHSKHKAMFCDLQALVAQYVTRKGEEARQHKGYLLHAAKACTKGRISRSKAAIKLTP